MPLPGEDFPGKVRGTGAVGNVTFIDAVEPLHFVPTISARTLAPSLDVVSFEAVDWPAVLEPLHHTAAGLCAPSAGARPGRGVLWGGMPIPHPTSQLSVEKPRALEARSVPIDLDRIGLVYPASHGLLLGQGLSSERAVRKREQHDQRMEKYARYHSRPHFARRRCLAM